jgi:CDP-6-deoxy-D-xylo-4-hexulose-3-dehydrase
MSVSREEVLALVRQYYAENMQTDEVFLPGDRLSYAGRVFDGDDVAALVDSALDFWLTAGRFADRFESELARFLNVPYCSLVNSGSSANLLAFMALTSHKLGNRRIAKGDEVITVAAGFPTTVAPIVQAGAVPVFVDIEIPSYNVDCRQLELALSSRTKAVMLAHTLGNPFDLKQVRDFCDHHGLWLVEDNCDALGSRYWIDGQWNFTGGIGDLGTSSFYPPHHMTMGEGGAVYTRNPQLKRIVDSLRDWGRDCWCKSGQDNTCKHRFSRQFGTLPYGYDHKYVYSHLGYNLKATDMQAAIGCAQLPKLPEFICRRRENWAYLHGVLTPLKEFFILPETAREAEPSWFGFMLTVRESAPFDRNDIVAFLEDHNVQTRMLFAGNITRHPCFMELREGTDYRIATPLANTDQVMNRSFWVGVYPGLDQPKLDYLASLITEFVEARRSQPCQKFSTTFSFSN